MSKGSGQVLLVSGIVVALAVVATVVGLSMEERSWAREELVFTDLDTPAGLAVDSVGNVYVSDQKTGQVLKLAPGESAATRVSVAGLTRPGPIAVARDGTLYVTDVGADGVGTVLKLTPGVASSVALPSPSEPPLTWPTSVAVDSEDTVYVTDRYMTDGAYLSGNARLLKLSAGASSWAVHLMPSTSADGHPARVNCPTYVAVDASDTLYAVDDCTHTVITLAKGSDSWTKTALAVTQDSHYPGRLVVDEPGNLYLSVDKIDEDPDNRGEYLHEYRVLRLDANSNRITRVAVGDLGASHDLAVADGILYTLDRDRKNVLKFSPNYGSWVTLVHPLYGFEQDGAEVVDRVPRGRSAG